jgi:hypothetical protein
MTSNEILAQSPWLRLAGAPASSVQTFVARMICGLLNATCSLRW